MAASRLHDTAITRSSIGRADIVRLRLANQLILAGRASPAGVVSRLVAMQAQDYLGALWAIGLRVPDSTEVSIEHALAKRSIIRTWPARGTLHFVTAPDIRWLLQLLTPRIIAASKGRLLQLELDESTLARCRELFVRALSGGRSLSRPAIFAFLQENGISIAGQRGIHILQRLSQEALICFGAREGKQQTFALLDEWSPGGLILDRDQALVELTKRYFLGHGPATTQDFAWWSGLTLTAVRSGIAMAGGELEGREYSGKTYWLSRDLEVAPDTMGCVRLLPPFDEFLMGYRDRGPGIDRDLLNLVQPGSNGMVNATMVIDDRIVGTWKRTIERTKVSLVMRTFEALDESQKCSLHEAAEKYGAFLGMPASIQVSE